MIRITHYGNLVIMTICGALIAGIAGCRPGNDKPSAMSSGDDLNRYVDREAGYSLQLPEDWTTQDGILASPPEGEDDPFIENVHVVVTPADGRGLDEFSEKLLSTFDMGYPNLKIISRNGLRIDGVPAVVAHYRYSDEANTIITHCIAYFVIKDDRAAAIVFSAAEANFDDWRPQFEAIGLSFRFE